MPALRGQIDFAIGADVQRGLPVVPARAVQVAAGIDARRADGGAVGTAPGKPGTVRGRSGKAAGRSRHAAARAGATDKAQTMSAADWRRWLLANAGDGVAGYKAAQVGYQKHVIGNPKDFDEFCRELARRCGV